MITCIVRSKCSQSERSHELLGNEVQHASSMHIIETITGRVPEAFIEVLLALVTLLFIICGLMINSAFLVQKLGPFIHQAEGVVPEGVHLDWFTLTRCNWNVINTSIHPGQRCSWMLCYEQSIMRVDMYAMICTLHVPGDSIDKALVDIIK